MLTDEDYYADANYYSGVQGLQIQSASELEAKGWRVWLLTLFPFWFSQEFSEDHIRFWELRWSVLHRIKRGEPIEPKELVVLLILARGLGKSVVLETARIMRGAILGTGYSLMVSETDDQATEHLGNCRLLIEHPDSLLTNYYPGMAISEHSDALKGMPTADRKEMFICKNGLVIRAKGLHAKMRGLRVGTQRPTDISLDDIDDVNDSLAVSLSKERQITATILGTIGEGMITIDVGQNLITEHSFVNRVYTGKTDAFSERTVIGVTNAFTHLDIESKPDEKGQIRHYIQPTSIASWAGLDIQRAQKFLHNSGYQTFMAEYQNEFDQFKSGKVIPEYSPESQRITWSQFQSVFNERRIPKHWSAKVGLDVGYSEGLYPHWSAWVFVATSGMNSKHPGLLFIYRARGFKGTSIDDQAAIIKSEMFEEEEKMIDSWQMSHEKSGEMMTLRQRHDLPFSKFKFYKSEDGVAQWRHLSKSDKTKPNPFKEDKLIDGEYVLGRPWLYYIVDDEQEFVPTDDHGMKLMHDQVSTWNYVAVKLNDSGQTVQKPSKTNDDMCDAAKGTLVLFGPEAAPLNADEIYEQRLNALLPKQERGEELTPQDHVPADYSSDITRRMAEARLQKQMRQESAEEFALPSDSYMDIDYDMEGWD